MQLKQLFLLASVDRPN